MDTEVSEYTAPLAVVYCERCYLVQLTHVMPPSELFTHYLYFSSFSESYLEHARRMADHLTERLALNNRSRVLEVASNDGYLLQYFQRSGVPVLGVEPAENIASEAIARGIPTLKRFFDMSAVGDIVDSFGYVDLIVGNNVLAHVPTVNEFLSATRECLKPGGHAIFEFPYVRDLLEHREFDTIYHEHVFYYSLSAISVLAKRAGLELVDVQHQPVHGGSLRVFLQKGGTRGTEAVKRMLAEEKAQGLTQADHYRKFSGLVSQLRTDLLTLLCNLKSAGKKIAAYGAPAKGNTLLNYCGITSDLIEFTVDKSPHKQGLFLPGSHIPILAPEALLERDPDSVLILPWNIASEIMSQQASFLSRGHEFIVPVPTPRVISGNGAANAVSATSAIH